MSSWAVRAAMVPITRRVRAYFAPVNRESGRPTIFDPSKDGAFVLDNPPSPWLDAGWIENFQRSCTTKMELMQGGTQGTTIGQYRNQLGAEVDFEFREWGKLQMALASGSEHMNVLASGPNAEAVPSGGTPIAAVAVLPSSTAAEIMLGTGAVDAFSAGDLIAVDMDYQQQVGYVGASISAAYVRDPADVGQDRDYIRRVTFNLGRIAEKTVTSLLLAQALPGGTPPPGAAIQKVVAFVDRESGSFFPEWSGLFIAEEESGGRVCFYYPRLGPGLHRAKNISQREGRVEIANPLASLTLSASFVALPYKDENDAQNVVCYRSYFPAARASVY